MKKKKTRTIVRTPSFLSDFTIEPQVDLRGYQRDKRKQRMIEAMRESLCLVTYACKKAGIARKTHYNWLATDNAYREAIETVEEGVFDYVEKQMLECIRDKNVPMLKFYSACKMRKRGFSERQEIVNGDGEAFRVAGSLRIEDVKSELPPAAVENVIRRLVGDNAKAAAALERLVNHG